MSICVDPTAQTKNQTDQVLELPAPNPIILVERVLVSYTLQTDDLFFLGENRDSRIIQNNLHCPTG